MTNDKDRLELFNNRKDHYQELVLQMPFNQKVYWAKQRIKEFIIECQNYNLQNPNKQIKEITISFSGGKDSTVLLDLVCQVVASMKTNFYLVPAYAMEITFPSTIRFINEIIEQYRQKYSFLKEPYLVAPKMPWVQILEQKGYPIYSKQVSVLLNRVKRARTKNCLTKWFFGIDQASTNTSKYKISKSRLFLLDDRMLANWPKINHEMLEYFKLYNEPYFFSEKCCDFVKGNLKHDMRPSFIGTMAEESEMRKRSWIKNGCNIFSSKNKKSRPLSIWTSEDVWKYIEINNLAVNPAYGYKDGGSLNNLHFTRLGCSSCPYGSAIENKRLEIINKKNKQGTVKHLNRFEKLKQYYPNLYKSQIIYTGMYRILIDMGIQISNDENYWDVILFKCSMHSTKTT